MITCKLQGRLGNQLYIYAATIAHSIKHKDYYFIPTKTIDKKWKSYRIGNVNYGEETFDTRAIVYKQPSHGYSEIPYYKGKKTILSGYFQSYKYFDFCLPEIIKIFNFKYEPSDKIAIHVRRGDYLKKGADKFPVVTDKYINDAIDYLNSKDIVKENTKFKFYSDDIAWCRQFVSRTNIPPDFFEFSEGKSDIQDLEEMSSCAHIITANSSYSVWAGMLNKNPNKIIIAPHEDDYFGKLKKHLDVSTIYPKEWVRIKF